MHCQIYLNIWLTPKFVILFSANMQCSPFITLSLVVHRNGLCYKTLANHVIKWQCCKGITVNDLNFLTLFFLFTNKMLGYQRWKSHYFLVTDPERVQGVRLNHLPAAYSQWDQIISFSWNILEKWDKICKAKSHTFIHMNPLSRNPGSASAFTSQCQMSYLIKI